MISVIIPVYNVEPYLRKCLDSVLNQTYRDLEILVIDDGSTDGCGAICDEYAEKDERIRVFHAENRGLSAARNLGLDNATGEWIGFVDSDDWIEPDMYEVLLNKAVETGADIVECGVFRESSEVITEQNNLDMEITGSEAIELLLQESISNAVWNKLWKQQCFNNIRFPDGRIFEEHATTYRVFQFIRKVCVIKTAKYHYLYRPESLSQLHNIKNLIDCWVSNRERKESLWEQVDEDGKRELLRLCAIAIARTWAYICDCSDQDRTDNDFYLKEMNSFSAELIPLFGFKGWDLALRTGIFFSHFKNRASYRASWVLMKINIKLKFRNKNLSSPDFAL